MVKIAVFMKQGELRKSLCSQLMAAFGRAVNALPVEISETFAESKEVYSRKCPDILIMDLEDIGYKGVELAEELQNIRKNMKIIFLAGQPSAVTEIFRVQPSDFFVKPVKMEKLLHSVGKLIHQLDQEDQNYFVVTFKGCVFQVRTRDILYFESQKRTVILHGRDGRWVVYRKLDDIQKEMPDYFVRCHQSYLVNMNDIRSMRAFRLELEQGKMLPVSRPRYRQAKARFLDFTGGNLAF